MSAVGQSSPISDCGGAATVLNEEVAWGVFGGPSGCLQCRPREWARRVGRSCDAQRAASLMYRPFSDAGYTVWAVG